MSARTYFFFFLHTHLKATTFGCNSQLNVSPLIMNGMTSLLAPWRYFNSRGGTFNCLRYWQESWLPLEVVSHSSVPWCPVFSTWCWVTLKWGKGHVGLPLTDMPNENILSGKHWLCLSLSARWQTALLLSWKKKWHWHFVWKIIVLSLKQTPSHENAGCVSRQRDCSLIF